MRRRFHRGLSWLLGLLGMAGCTCRGPDAETPPDARSIEPETAMLQITAESARTAGLPAIGLTLDVPDTGWSVSRFVEAGNFLLASGPPGAPEGFRVDGMDGAADAEGLRAAAARRYGEGLDWGAAASVEVGGRAAPALTVAVGESLARAEHLLVARAARDGVLLLDYWRSGGSGTPSTPAAFLEDPEVAAWFQNLKLSDP